MTKKMSAFERLFGNWPAWKQRLMRKGGVTAVKSTSKHARGHRPKHGCKEARRRARKAAKASRRINR